MNRVAMIKDQFIYTADVVDVYDGDSITIDVDLGLHAHLKGEKMRLFGIDSPELRGEERPDGLKSRDYLRGLILDKTVTIETIKDKKGKYGRWLCKVWTKDLDINAHLVEHGYAEWRDY